VLLSHQQGISSLVAAAVTGSSILTAWLSGLAIDYMMGWCLTAIKPGAGSLDPSMQL
jgi:hypothetical protein